MYLRHFALTRLPFETPAHTDELFESNARREAEARLHHLIELKGIGLMTGEVGSGKTTVCRQVAANLHPGLHRVGYVSLTTGNVLDMYKAIAWELGLPDRESAMQAHRRRAIPPNRPLDLFSTSLSTMPSWERLPARTRQAVTTLLARMLLAHARGPSQEPGSDTDER